MRVASARTAARAGLAVAAASALTLGLATSASHWVNNTYGGLFANSSKFGTGGTFSVNVFVKATLDDGSVCGQDVECAVVTRADHFDTNDRAYDVHVPITFQ